ncbi:MAG TPA: response regulator [Bacteroidales bacterium]|nr:response regulator [Bacteroidales bacterium]
MKDQLSPERKSVLIVEDDAHSQLYFSKLLSGMYDISAVTSARDAWNLLHSESFDLVLMDISLAGEEDGLSLTRRLRKEEAFKELPILAVTAYAFPEDKPKALAAGCTDYLSKPVSSGDLHRKIAELTKK